MELKREFTSYKLENVVKLKSSYAIRIYELLKQYEKLEERSFFLRDLRKILGAEDIYPAYGNFKQRVLIPAQQELKRKTDINFEIEEIKVGRKVERVKFVILKGKKQTPKQIELFDESLKEFQNANSFQQRAQKMALSMGIKLNDKVIATWEKFGPDRVIDLMEQVHMRPNIDNPIGYITTVLKSSVAEKEVAARYKSEKMLLHLISSFGKSNESRPAWFVKDLAIEELQNTFGLDKNKASVKFEDLKQELFAALNVDDQTVNEMSEEEVNKKEIEQLF